MEALSLYIQKFETVVFQDKRQVKVATLLVLFDLTHSTQRAEIILND